MLFKKQTLVIPGMPMGMADVATVLFKDFLNFDPKIQIDKQR